MRISAGPLGVTLGLSVSACFLKPDPPAASDARIEPRDDGSVGSNDVMPLVDAMIDGSPCTRYEFNGSSANCGGFGSGSGTIAVGNGVLTLTVPGASASTTACNRSSSVFSTVTFDVASVPSTFGTSTDLFVRSGGMRYGLRWESASLFIPYCDSNDGTQVANTRYLRIRKTATDTRTDYSQDGTTWMTTPLSCPPLGSAEIGVEVKRGTTGPVDATLGLESIEICP